MKELQKIMETSKILTTLIILLFAGGVYAQTPEYKSVVKNDTLLDARTYQFDIFIERSGAEPFNLALYNLALEIGNSAVVINGGTLTFSIEDSELPPSHWPESITSHSTGGNTFLRVNSPLVFDGTPIPDTPVLMATVKITNDKDFGLEKMGLEWSFGFPAITNIMHLPVGEIIPVNINNEPNHIIELTDPILNKEILAYNVTGTGSYCVGADGLAVGLDDSEAGVFYQLLKDGNPVGDLIEGDGNPIDFGVQPIGNYTVYGYRPGHYPTDMEGNANITENPLPVVTIGDEQTIAAGEEALPLTSEVTVGPEPYQYQWYEWDGSDWVEIPGADEDTYEPGILTDNKLYRLEVTDANDCVGVSNEVLINIFGLSNLLVDDMYADLYAPVCQGISYVMGLENSEPDHYHILYRVTLDDNYVPEYTAVAENKNEDGGTITWGTYNRPGKYISYFYEAGTYSFTLTNTGPHPLDDYHIPGTSTPTLQIGEFWIIEQPAVRSVTFTGTPGVDYTILPDGEAVFCSAAGSITMDNPEYSPVEYGEEWNVTYTLYRNNTPYAEDVNGNPVDPIVNPGPGVNKLVWNNLHSGTYTIKAERTPCDPITFPDPGLTIILVGEPENVEIASIDDLATITGTPVVLDVDVTYGDLDSQNIDPNVMADARISFDPQLPAGARIVELLYNDTQVAADVPISGEDNLLLSQIIGAGAPNPLAGHHERTDTWKIVVDGVDVVGTYSVTFEALAYYGQFSDGLCVYVLDSKAFNAAFAPATVADIDDLIVCYDADVEFDYEITYPAITNVHASITNDAKIQVFDAEGGDPKNLNTGASIEISLGGISFTYTLSSDYNTFYLSALLAGQATPTTAAAQNPLQGHSGTDNWSFVVKGANPGNYFVDITNFAQLGSVEYPYAGESFALNYIGALGVDVTASDDISTVTGAPVIFNVTVDYGDLAAQDIDPDVQVDALITLDDDPAYILPPDGAEIVEILLDDVSYWTGNYDIEGKNEFRLSEILGATGALIDHNGLTHKWTVIVNGLTGEGTLSAVIHSIAYVDFNECYSVLNEDTFKITLKDLEIQANNPGTVCEGTDIESQFVIKYPSILNNPDDITTDAVIIANRNIPDGVEVAWAYSDTQGGVSSGTYTFAAQLDADVPIKLSEIVAGAPTPLQGHDALTVTWDFVFKGLPVNTYTLTVTSIAILGADEFALGTDPDPIQQSFTVLPLPDATITGPAVVYSGTKHEYVVPVPTGVPSYKWDAVDAWVSIDDDEANPVTVTFTWGPDNYGITTLTVTVDNGTCKATGFLEVEVRPNRLAGQVKYYNSLESPMPSPFMTNHDGNLTFPDFFYVALLGQDFEWGVDHPYDDAISVVKVDEIYGEDGNVLFPSDYYEAAFYFDYNLDPGKNYMVTVWDGGYYEEAASGEWSLEGELGKSWTWNNWGGVNSTDALIILNMVVQQNIVNFPHIGDFPYNPYSIRIADVNDSGNLTGLDALLTSRRSIGLLQKFPGNQPNFEVAGLFVDESDFNTNNIFTQSISPSVFEYTGLSSYLWSTLARNHAYMQTINAIDQFEPTGNRYLNIYYTAAGDVNASYIPEYGGFKDVADVELIINGEISAGIGQEVDIPFTFDQHVHLGALSLGLNYRNDLIEITGTNYGEEFAYFDNKLGILRIGWAELKGIPFNVGDEAAIITVRILTDIPEGTQLFEVDSFTELADASAKVIQGVNLYAPALVSGDEVVSITDPQNTTQINVTNFPNPFNNHTTIRYELPENGKVQLMVFNNMGQLVKTLVDEEQQTGIHEINIQSHDLTGPGVYYYRLNVTGVQNSYTVTNSMIMIK